MRKKNISYEVVAVSVIIIAFIGITVMYLFKSANVRDNKDNVISKITDENNYSNIEESQDINIYEEKTTLKEIAKYTTNIYDDEKNRVYNIKLACKNLNNTLVRPGEEFSFNSKMGDMGKKEGYKKATGFDSNGKNIKVYGGGICQISSTLYNALLIADLDVTERHAHSKRVYYVPKNKDATVFSGGPDLKFKNNKNSNIIIYATTDGYEVTVTLKEEVIT